MGKINTIYEPNEWEIILEGESKLNPDDYVYKMVIGEYDDYPEVGPITEFISKENYEKILTGELCVKKFPYEDEKVVIMDKDDNIVPLLKEVKEDKKNGCYGLKLDNNPLPTPDEIGNARKRILK